MRERLDLCQARGYDGVESDNVGTYSLRGCTTKKKQIIALPTFASTETGTVQIKVTTAGKRVYVDGLGVLKF